MASTGCPTCLDKFFNYKTQKRVVRKANEGWFYSPKFFLVSTTPASGSEVSSINQVVFTFNDTIVDLSDGQLTELTLLVGNSNENADTDIASVSLVGNQMIVTFTDSLIVNGDIVSIIPEALISGPTGRSLDVPLLATFYLLGGGAFS